MFTDPTEDLKYLEWRGREAWRDGRKRFSIEHEKHGWYLYRYTEKFGKVSFKSKEKVNSVKHGRDYAETLARLANFEPMQI